MTMLPMFILTCIGFLVGWLLRGVVMRYKDWPSAKLKGLRRLVRRFWVPRSEYDAKMDALRAALNLILAHHNCGKRIELGGVCPHCTDANGDAPVLSRIYNEIDSPADDPPDLALDRQEAEKQRKWDSGETMLESERGYYKRGR
jgi:hypothetical protein